MALGALSVRLPGRLDTGEVHGGGVLGQGPRPRKQSAAGSLIRREILALRAAPGHAQEALDQPLGVAPELLEDDPHARGIGLDAHHLTDALDGLDAVEYDGEAQVHL